MKIFRNVSPLGIAARICGIGFAFWVSLFALDAFNEDLSFWNMLAALIIHLVPTIFILAVILIAWKYEWLGAFVFLILGLLYITTRQADVITYIVIAGPMFLTGILFLFSWLQQRHADREYDVKG